MMWVYEGLFTVGLRYVGRKLKVLQTVLPIVPQSFIYIAESPLKPQSISTKSLDEVLEGPYNRNYE